MMLLNDIQMLQSLCIQLLKFISLLSISGPFQKIWVQATSYSYDKCYSESVYTLPEAQPYYHGFYDDALPKCSVRCDGETGFFGLQRQSSTYYCQCLTSNEVSTYSPLPQNHDNDYDNIMECRVNQKLTVFRYDYQETTVASTEAQPVWSGWSECTQSCNYGTQMRENLGLLPPAYEHRACNIAKCDETTPDAKDFSECEQVNGFYTKHACYFVRELGSLAAYNIDSFGACQSADGEPALFLDTAELLDHFFSFALEKYPNHSFWMPAKHYQMTDNTLNVRWMMEIDKPGPIAYFPSVQPVQQIGEFCLVGEAMPSSPSPSHISIRTVDCSEGLASAVVCMKSTNKADYEQFNDMRLIVVDQDSYSHSTTATSSWFCGLECEIDKGLFKIKLDC